MRQMPRWRLLSCGGNISASHLHPGPLLCVWLNHACPLPARHVSQCHWRHQQHRVSAVLCRHVLRPYRPHCPHRLLQCRLLLHWQFIHCCSQRQHNRQPVSSWRLLPQRRVCASGLPQWHIQLGSRRHEQLSVPAMHSRLILCRQQQAAAHWPVLCRILLHGWGQLASAISCHTRPLQHSWIHQRDSMQRRQFPSQPACQRLHQLSSRLLVRVCGHGHPQQLSCRLILHGRLECLSLSKRHICSHTGFAQYYPVPSVPGWQVLCLCWPLYTHCQLLGRLLLQRWCQHSHAHIAILARRCCLSCGLLLPCGHSIPYSISMPSWHIHALHWSATAV